MGKEEVQQPLTVLLATGTILPQNISEQHLFLGYKPLIIGIPAERSSEHFDFLSKNQFIKLFFRDEESAKTIAELKLRFLQRKDFGKVSLFIFEGVKGSHHLLSSFHQFTNRMREVLVKRKAGNINLEGNLYEQVRITYAYPRIISIATLGNGERFNMFPTDLNGSIDNKHYVISLRRDGKVNEQVEDFKKICLASVNISFCKEAYRMGKNHMQPLQSLNEFKISSERSDELKLPLPLEVLSYKELELMESIDVGIHRLHFFKIIHEKSLKLGLTLAHVHRFYASWEMKRGKRAQFLMH